MTKANFDYRSTNSRASRIYHAIIGAFPECRSRAQWYMCLKAAAKMTDAEAAEIVARYSTASGVWAMLPESEQIETVQKLAAALPARAQRRAMAATVGEIRADVDNGGNGNSVRGKFPAYVRWMLDKRGNVTAAAVQLVASDAWAYLPRLLKKADESGKTYFSAVCQAVENAARAEYAFQNPGRMAKNYSGSSSLEELNETGEKAKLGTCGDRNISRETETKALNRARIREALNGTDGEILRLYAMGFTSAEIAERLKVKPATIRQRIHRFQSRNGDEIQKH